MIYFNEFDTHAAEWLRELSREGLVPEAFVDGRSIKEVQGEDLEGHTQCHFFAGIGGWSEALRLAGWPQSLRLWTGSCPCQPFSSAGKGLGADDPRHLWPDFLRLIAQCRPPVVFGEQVASAAGREWLSGVRADLEALGYAVGCADLCAAGVGAPHLRQRLYWVAYAQCHGQERVIIARDHDLNGATAGRIEAAGRSAIRGRADAVGHAGPSPDHIVESNGKNQAQWNQTAILPARCRGPVPVGDTDEHGRPGELGAERKPDASEASRSLPVGDTDLPGCGEQRRPLAVQPQQSATELRGDPDASGHTSGRGQPIGGNEAQPRGGGHAVGSGWSRFDVILCRDGKHRRIPAGAQPLVQPVVDGIPVSLDELWGSGSPLALENAYPLTPKMSGGSACFAGPGTPSFRRRPPCSSRPSWSQWESSMAEHPQWRFTPEASLPLTILHSLPDGFTAVTLPAPWVMPADAVLWIQSTRSAWQPGPAHVFESDLPVRHETQQTQDPAEPAARAKGAGAQTKPASRSRVVERIPLAADLPGLF